MRCRSRDRPGWFETGMNPFGCPVGKILFFPDRDDLLEPIYQKASRFECVNTMGATNGDRDTDISQCEVSQPVDDPQLGDGPVGSSLLGELLELGQCHLGIGLVVECQCSSFVGHFTYGSQKQHDGSGRVIADRFGQCGRVDGFVSECDHEKQARASRH